MGICQSELFRVVSSSGSPRFRLFNLRLPSSINRQQPTQLHPTQLHLNNLELQSIGLGGRVLSHSASRPYATLLLPKLARVSNPELVTRGRTGRSSQSISENGVYPISGLSDYFMPTLSA